MQPTRIRWGAAMLDGKAVRLSTWLTTLIYILRYRGSSTTWQRCVASAALWFLNVPQHPTHHTPRPRATSHHCWRTWECICIRIHTYYSSRTCSMRDCSTVCSMHLIHRIIHPCMYRYLYLCWLLATVAQSMSMRCRSRCMYGT